jgi:hypothetical protein
MTNEIETIVSTQEGAKISVSDWDDGAWLHLQVRGGSAYATLTRSEAQQLLAGLQLILAQEVTA